MATFKQLLDYCLARVDALEGDLHSIYDEVTLKPEVVVRGWIEDLEYITRELVKIVGTGLE